MSFTENVRQTSHVNVYYPGADHCSGSTTCNSTTPVATCNNCDWEFSEVSCNAGCPSQPACSEIDGATCPDLGQNVQYEWNVNNGICPIEPTVKCTYDSKTFNYSDIVKYQQNFCSGNNNCPGNSNYNNTIMPNFCFNETTICPIVPGTTSSWSNCPNILSNINGQSGGNPGSTCSAWASSNKVTSDISMNTHCTSNPDDGTCQCVNRANSSVYQYINNGMNQSGGFSPGCWYKSCANPQAFLVPSTVNNTNCNMSQVCARVNQIISSTPTSLSKQQLQAELNCNITATPIQTSNSTASTVPFAAVTSNNPVNSVTTTTSSWWWIIIIIIIIIIILIIIFFIYYGTSTETVIMATT